MKQFVLTILMALPLMGLAQSDTTAYWNKGGSFGVNFTQSTLSNWSAGGSSSIAGAVQFRYFFDYKRDKTLWKNVLDMGIGVIKESESRQRKADDRLVFMSSYGRKISNSDKWYYNATLDFRTQFAKGFNAEDVNQEEYISKFMAPGYLMISMGVDWRPNEYWSFALSPVTGKFTFVNDDQLSAAGAFGVTPGEKSRAELGGKFIITFDKEIFKNGSLASSMILFSNYTENPEKVDINWENTLTMKINSLLSANIFNQVIYDYDIKFEEFDADGNLLISEARWQFKNIFGLGLAYKFGGVRGQKAE